MKSNSRFAIICGKAGGQARIKCFDALNNFANYLLFTSCKSMIQLWCPFKLSLGFQEWSEHFHNSCFGECIRALLNQPKPASDTRNVCWSWKFPDCSDKILWWLNPLLINPESEEVNLFRAKLKFFLCEQNSCLCTSSQIFACSEKVPLDIIVPKNSIVNTPF